MMRHLITARHLEFVLWALAALQTCVLAAAAWRRRRRGGAAGPSAPSAPATVVAACLRWDEGAEASLASLLEQEASFPWELLVVAPEGSEEQERLSEALQGRGRLLAAEQAPERTHERLMQWALGAERARPESGALVFTSLEARFPKDWLSRTAEPLSDPSVGAVTAPLLPGAAAPLWEAWSAEWLAFASAAGAVHDGALALRGEDYRAWRVGEAFGRSVSVDEALRPALGRSGKRLAYAPALEGVGRASAQGLLASMSRAAMLLRWRLGGAWPLLFLAVLLKTYILFWALRPPNPWRLLTLTLAVDWAYYLALLLALGRVGALRSALWAALSAAAARAAQTVGFLDALFVGDFVSGRRLYRPGPGGVEVLPAPIPEALRDNRWVVRTLSEATGRSKDEVVRRLRREEAAPGAGVRTELEARGVVPYAWSERMGAFYAEADAFLFELTVWNRDRYKRGMRNWIVSYLRGAPLRVLCYGDGMGFDSLCLARAGHQVVCQEPSPRTRAFARRLFERERADIPLVHDDAGLKAASFDAVVCLDVLEHVPDPGALVERFALWLKPGGRLIVHAPFTLVSRHVATHLEANRRFAGRPELYERAGLKLAAGRWLCWHPIVLQKEPLSPSPLGSWESAGLRLVGAAMRTGLYALVWGLLVDVLARTLNRLILGAADVAIFEGFEAEPFGARDAA